MIGPEEKRGIGLLRSVVESSEMAELDAELKSIKVTGTSGLSYMVTPGSGGHGSRFSVWPMSENMRANHQAVRGRGHSPPICIVEKPELKRLVAGDAVASVVMALLDDLSSRRNIDTLRNHIQNTVRQEEERANPEIAQMNEARWFRRRLRQNRVADRVRRYTEVLPMLWGALLRLPLGERMTFGAIEGRPSQRLLRWEPDTLQDQEHGGEEGDLPYAGGFRMGERPGRGESKGRATDLHQDWDGGERPRGVRQRNQPDTRA